MGKKEMITTNQFAKAINLPYATIVRWAQNGVLPGVTKEETLRGPVWLIPQAAVDNYEEWRPKRGRPQKPLAELKYKARRKGQ